MNASRAVKFALFSTAVFLAGCEHAPAVDVLGSFFPVWIFCIAGGIVATMVLDRVMIRFGARPDYGPPVLVYPSLVIIFACSAWLMLFR